MSFANLSEISGAEEEVEARLAVTAAAAVLATMLLREAAEALEAAFRRAFGREPVSAVGQPLVVPWQRHRQGSRESLVASISIAAR